MLIEYGKAHLRAIEEKDLDLLLFFMNSPEIEELTGGWHLPISSEQQSDWIRNYRNSDTNIRLMIELDNKETIGMISMTQIDWKNRTAHIGYKVTGDIHKRMKNDMHDAIIAILNYAFNEFGLNCIISTILEDNIFSNKLARKMGFVEEGRLRERIFKQGRFKDQIIYSMLKSDFCKLYDI